MATPGKPLLHRFSNTLDDGSVLTDDLFAMQLGIHRLEFKPALFRNLIKKKKKIQGTRDPQKPCPNRQPIHVYGSTPPSPHPKAHTPLFIGVWLRKPKPHTDLFGFQELP